MFGGNCTFATAFLCSCVDRGGPIESNLICGFQTIDEAEEEVCFGGGECEILPSYTFTMASPCSHFSWLPNQLWGWVPKEGPTLLLLQHSHSCSNYSSQNIQTKIR